MELGCHVLKFARVLCHVYLSVVKFRLGECAVAQCCKLNGKKGYKEMLYKQLVSIWLK